MFVITLSYLVDIDRIDEAMADHREWVDRQYEDGVFLASGPLVPRTGGMILAGGLSRSELEARLALDPYKTRGLAEHVIVEFAPRAVAPGLERLQA